MISLHRVKILILDLLFPCLCLGCRSEGEFFCQNCQNSLRFIPPTCIVCQKIAPAAGKIPLGRTCRPCRKKSFIYAYFSPFRYSEEPLRSLIHALKYQRIREIHKSLAKLLAAYCLYFNLPLPDNAVILPVPLYPAKERVRGFNQSALVAEALVSLLQEKGERIEYRSDVLRRVKSTSPQVDLSREERRKNLAKAFVVDRPKFVKQRTVVILDDVKTTGVTLEEAARVLREAGAKAVWAITVAH